MKSKAQNQSRFMRMVNAPIRLLSKARDMYVRKLSGLADRVSNSNFGCPGGQFSGLPRSFSTASTMRMRSSSEDEDLRELIRAASARTFGNRIDVDAIFKQHLKMKQSTFRRPEVLRKSCSVVMGRIDEDAPCDFGENKDGLMMYPRSRSYAVEKTRVVFQ